MLAWDAIVLGVGGIGSAALCSLARRGHRVLGIDRFQPPHDLGSSHGQTRMIRQAYFEHVDYVPLALRAYEMWRALEQRRGLSLLHRTGLIQVGPRDSRVLEGVIASARRHRLQIESLPPDEVHARWPGLQVPSNFCGAYEHAAGYLEVENCVQAHIDDALAAGASLHTRETVLEIKTNGSDLQLITDKGSYLTAKLIVAAGPWSSEWLEQIGIKITVLRKPQLWYATRTSDYLATNSFPAFLCDSSNGIFYGFPEIESGILKVAEHSGGAVVNDASLVNRDLAQDDRIRLDTFISHYLPGVSNRLVRASICMYSMSEDSHFVVDLYPHDQRIAIVAGLSGHGFKFAPVLGEALADLVLEGQTSHAIGLFQIDRFRTRDSQD